MGFLEQQAQEHGDGWHIPYFEPTAERRTSVMLKMARQPLAIGSPVAASIPRTFVLFTGKSADSWMTPIFGRIAARVRGARGWRYEERPYHHYPVTDGPEGVQAITELLLDLT